MNYTKWLKNNTKSLKGKKVVITGATGGLGKELCRYLLFLGADLILLNRNREKTENLIKQLEDEFLKINVKFILLRLEDKNSVNEVVKELEKDCPDIIIHNAGAYSIPRKSTNFGICNIFAINFFAPYYITGLLFEKLKEKSAKVVIVGSIAHNYSKINPNDIDFSTYNADSKVYGNAKRFLMLSMYEKFKGQSEISLSVTHPGITFTNITAHYPKLIFALIKNPMKIIFMKPRKAALSIIKGIFDDCGYGEWIGPQIFGIWGNPQKTKLKTFNSDEAEKVFEISEKLFCDCIESKNSLKE